MQHDVYGKKRTSNVAPLEVLFRFGQGGLNLRLATDYSPSSHLQT